MTLHLSTLLGLAGPNFLPMLGRSEPSATQKRMHAAWLAGEPARRKLAVEIAAWNAAVDKRNAEKRARKAARRAQVMA